MDVELSQKSITPEVAGQFDLLRGRVSRMEAMIKVVLQYSRMDRTETQLETVDIGALLTEVIDFKPADPPCDFHRRRNADPARAAPASVSSLPESAGEWDQASQQAQRNHSCRG